MTVLKICIGEWNNASRDQRELAVCRELGADVKVLAKGDRTDRGRIEMVNTFEVHRFTTRPVRRFPTAINRILSVFDWARYARKLRPAVISGHDIGGLLIGWLSVFFLFGKKRPRLVYDSHEFELGRNVDRSKAVTLCLGLLERFLIRRSVFTIVVNQSIAQELKRVHHMKTDPVVVRNIPDKWFVDDTVCASMKKKLLESMGASEGTVLMYHGALVRGRGIEQSIRVLLHDEDLKLVVLGDDSGDGYLDKLKELAGSLGVNDRILFHEAVPQSELWKYVGAADISMVIIEPRAKSYYLSLPNKLFESIQSHTPVVASDLPEIKRIVDNYQVGEICDPEDLESVLSAIERLKKDQERWTGYRENEIRASDILNWEKESNILKNSYEKILK